jgi:prepilin-type N-terminal cleavage/methylation domain-containing protein
MNLLKTSLSAGRFARPSRRGMTLVEVVVALGLGSVVMVAVMSLILYTARSFIALSNYIDLDSVSRNALDVMSQEIREADRLVSGSETQLTFARTDPLTGTTSNFSYSYNPVARELLRLEAGDRRVLLRECDFLQFSLFQRNKTRPNMDPIPVTLPGTCKFVQLRWVCSRQILRQAVNTESVQSAVIVIRRQ